MTLRQTPHRVDLYRRTASGAGLLGEPWTLLTSNVPFDVQMASGEVAAAQYGRLQAATYPAFAHHGTDIRADDGVLIVASEIPSMIGRRFTVRSGLDMGARGDWQGSIEDTHEDFGA